MKIFEQNATKVLKLEQLEYRLKTIPLIYEDTEDQINSAKRFLRGLGIQGVRPPLMLDDFKRIGRSISDGCSANSQTQNVIMGYYIDSVISVIYKK